MKKLLLLPIIFLYSLVASAQIITATTNDCEFKFTLPNLTFGAGIAANLKTTRYVSFDQIHYKRIMVNNSSPEQFQVFLTLGIETFSFSESIATSYYGITATALFNQIVAVIDASACGGGGGGIPGTVTDFIFTDGGGLDGTVATSTTTPTLSIVPSFTGLVQATSGVGFSATTIGSGLSFVGGTLSATGGAGWLLDGNTVTAEKWIGTIDNFDFPIRTNNVETWRFKTNGVIANAGNRFLYTFGTNNIFLGTNSGNLTLTGFSNTVSGDNAGDALTSGFENTLVGHNAGGGLTSGDGHTLIGFRAGELLTNEPLGCTFVGVGTGANTLSGAHNTFVGHQIGLGNTTGALNTYIGGAATAQANNGNWNTFIGTDVVVQATGVSECVVIGVGAMNQVVAGAAHYNTVIGNTAFNGLAGAGTKNICIGYTSGQRFAGTAGVINQSIYIGAGTVAERGGEICIGTAEGLMTHCFLGGSQYVNSTLLGATFVTRPPSAIVAGTQTAAFPGGSETNATNPQKWQVSAGFGTGTGNAGAYAIASGYPVASGATSNTAVDNITVFSANTSDNFIGIGLTPTINQGTTFSYTGVDINVTETATGSGTKLIQNWRVGGTSKFSISNTGQINVVKGIDATAGDAATVNAVAGRFRKDATGTTFTLTNSFITANSIVMLQYASDTGITGFDSYVVAGAGSAVITFTTSGVAAAPTNNTDVNFLVIN